MPLARNTVDALKPEGAVPSQIVTFRVADRVFGVDVGVVREIKGWQPTTPLPATAGHVLGVINLRGQIVPVHDLAQLIGMAGAETAAGKVVIVLDCGAQPYGIVADAVSDILDVVPGDFRPSPFSAGIVDALVSSLVIKDETVIALLNADAVSGASSPAAFH